MYELINFLFGIPLALAQAATRSTVDGVASETENQITSIVSFIVSQIPLWITAFIVIVMSFVLARIVKSSVENKMTAEGFEEEHKEIQLVAGRTANAAVLIIGITVGLKIAGLDLTPLLAAGAFGVGFALQDLIMNFIAGVMILSARHYSIGDVITVNGTMGKIVDIQTRATVLKAFDGTRIVVPNAELFKSQVKSYTSNPMRRIQVAVYCRYGVDMEEVMALCLKIVKQHSEALLHPKPTVYVADMGDYYIELGVRFWVIKGTAWFKLKSQIFMEIEKALEELGMEAPYPVTSLSLEEDVESAVVKTYQMNKDDVKEMLEERKHFEEEVEKKKENYINGNVPASGVQRAPDSSGVNFLNNTAGPAATVSSESDAPAWLKQAAQQTETPAPTTPPVQPNENFPAPTAFTPATPTPTVPETPPVIVPTEPAPVAQQTVVAPAGQPTPESSASVPTAPVVPETTPTQI